MAGHGKYLINAYSVADPYLELRGGGGVEWGGGLDLLALSAIFPSVISSCFTQNKGRGGGGAGRKF